MPFCKDCARSFLHLLECDEPDKGLVAIDRNEEDVTDSYITYHGAIEALQKGSDPLLAVVGVDELRELLELSFQAYSTFTNARATFLGVSASITPQVLDEHANAAVLEVIEMINNPLNDYYV